MKATILCGGGDPQGVTRCMCDSAAETLPSLGFDVEIVILHGMDIGHCTDCGACRGGDCVIEDDMGPVYRSFEHSDVLILASPLHFSGPSSLIKTAMDRFQPYWYDRDRPHPRLCLGMLCGGSAEPRFSHTVSIFRAFSLTTGMKWSGHLEVPDTDARGKDGVPEKVDSFLRETLA